MIRYAVALLLEFPFVFVLSFDVGHLVNPPDLPAAVLLIRQASLRVMRNHSVALGTPSLHQSNITQLTICEKCLIPQITLTLHRNTPRHLQANELGALNG